MVFERLETRIVNSEQLNASLLKRLNKTNLWLSVQSVSSVCYKANGKADNNFFYFSIRKIVTFLVFLRHNIKKTK